jgi:hypothetical protein
MKKLVLQICILTVFSIQHGGMFTAIAQEMDPLQLVENHLGAIGKSAVIEGVSVCKQQGRVKVSRLGKTREYLFTRIVTRDGKYFYTQSNLLGGVIYKAAFDGKKGWWYDRGKVHNLTGNKLAVIKSYPFISPFLNADYYRGQLIGVKGRKSGYTLSVKDPNGELHTYTFGKTDFLLQGEVYRDELGILNMIEYTQHQDFEGLLMPSRVEWTRYTDTEGKPLKEVRVYTLKTVNLNPDEVLIDQHLKQPD